MGPGRRGPRRAAELPAKIMTLSLILPVVLLPLDASARASQPEADSDSRLGGSNPSQLENGPPGRHRRPPSDREERR